MQNQRQTALLMQVEEWKSALPIRGVARFNPKEKSVTVSFLNLEEIKGGRYYIAFGERVIILEGNLVQEIYGIEELPENQSIALLFYDGNQILPVLSGSFSSRKANLDEALGYAKKHFKIQDEEDEAGAFLQDEEYDDEAIAESNYYELDSSIERGREADRINERDTNQELSDGEEQPKKEEKERDFTEKEPASDGYGEGEWATGCFYAKIKEELESVLKEYPKEEDLCKMVYGSRWVRVGEGSRHYAVGVIYKNGEPEYICYGLPGAFAIKPEGAEGFSSFIPLSPFKLKGEGYWVTFQRASDGKCVK